MRALLLALLSSASTAALAQGAAQPTTLGFGQAVDMAISASPRRAEAQAELDADVARRAQALSDLGPKLRGDYVDTTFDQTVAIPFGAETFTIRPDRYRDGSLTVTQPVTGLYTAYERGRAARAQRDASGFGLDQAKTDAAFGAAEAYRRAQQADELVTIAQANIATTASQVRDAEHLAGSGRLIRSDLLKIRISQEDAKAQLARAIAGRKKAYERLANAVGLGPGQPFTLEPRPRLQSVTHAAGPTLAGALEKATAVRPDVKAAELGIEKAEHAQNLARWKFAPSVDLFLKWDRVYSEPPFGTPPFTRSYGVAASWELWDNGSRVYAAQEVAAGQRKAAAALQEVKDRLRLELQSSLADLDAARESLAAAQASVAQAEEAYRLDKARFASGLLTATDLLLSEASQTRARGAVVTAATEVDVLELSVQKAMGEARPH